MQNQPFPQVRVLVAPLDWGLGHATRCIPIIRHLQQKGCSIWIAAEGRVRNLLQEEFPALPFLELKGYRIQYSNTGIGLWLKVSTLIPSILQTIRYEHRWLEKRVREFNFDLILSDNRFGLSHSSVRSVYLTHQLRIRVPGFRPGEALLQRLHYSFIRRFSTCWVPDAPGTPNLSGELGHPSRLPSVPVSYLGPLTRFRPLEPRGPRYHLLVLLSGPEPQRTFLEARILPDLGAVPGPVCLVRGLPGEQSLPPVPANVAAYNHLPSTALNEVICASTWVVARSGYSTLMDLVRLGKKGILVPTPGQTEQEYLAKYAEAQGLGIAVSQRGFRLAEALARAGEPAPGRTLSLTGDYRAVLDEVLEAVAGDQGITGKSISEENPGLR